MLEARHEVHEPRDFLFRDSGPLGSMAPDLKLVHLKERIFFVYFYAWMHRGIPHWAYRYDQQLKREQEQRERDRQRQYEEWRAFVTYNSMSLAIDMAMSRYRSMSTVAHFGAWSGCSYMETGRWRPREVAMGLGGSYMCGMLGGWATAALVGLLGFSASPFIVGCGALVAGYYGFNYIFDAACRRFDSDYRAAGLDRHGTGGVELRVNRPITALLRAPELHTSDSLHLLVRLHKPGSGAFEMPTVLGLTADECVAQVLDELYTNFTEHKDPLLFSLHFNRQRSMYSVMAPQLRNTLVGVIMMVVDCFLKGFLQGGVLRPEVLLGWEKNQGQDLRSHIVDIRAEFRRLGLHEYKCMNDLHGDLLDQEVDSDEEKDDAGAYRSAFRIIGSLTELQTDFQAGRNTVGSFQRELGFLVESDLTPSPEQRIKNLDAKVDKHAVRLRAQELMRDQIREMMPQFPLFKPWFDLLRLVTVAAHLVATIAPLGKRPTTLSRGKARSFRVPEGLPALPVRKPRLVPIHLTLARALALANDSVLDAEMQKAVLRQVCSQTVVLARCTTLVRTHVQSQVSAAGLPLREFTDADLQVPRTANLLAEILVRNARQAQAQVAQALRDLTTPDPEAKLPIIVRLACKIDETVWESSTLPDVIKACEQAVRTAQSRISLVPKSQVVAVDLFAEDMAQVRADKLAKFRAEADAQRQAWNGQLAAVISQLNADRAEINNTVARTPSAQINQAKLAQVRASIDSEEQRVRGVHTTNFANLASSVTEATRQLDTDLLDGKEKAVRAYWTEWLDGRLARLRHLDEQLKTSFLTKLDSALADKKQAGPMLLRRLRLSILGLGGDEWVTDFVGGCGVGFNQEVRVTSGLAVQTEAEGYWCVPLTLVEACQTKRDPSIDVVEVFAPSPEFPQIMTQQGWSPTSVVGGRSLLESLVVAGNFRVLDQLPPTPVPGDCMITAATTMHAPQVLEVLVGRHAGDINFARANGLTPLLAAVIGKNRAAAEACLKLGANPNVLLDDSSGVLSHALENQFPPAFFSGCKVDATSPARFQDGMTPLALACSLPAARVALLESLTFRREVLHVLADGRNMLHVVAENVNSEAAELAAWLLRTTNVDPVLQDKFDRLPGERARLAGNIKTARLLEDQTAPTHATGLQFGLSYLERALLAGNEPEVVAAVRVSPLEQFESAVHCALHLRRFDLLEQVIKMVPNIATHRFQQQDTLAHLIVRAGLADWLARAQRFGVDLSVANLEGKTVGDLILEADSPKAATQLMDLLPHDRQVMLVSKALGLGATKILTSMDAKILLDVKLQFDLSLRPTMLELAFSNGMKFEPGMLTEAARLARPDTLTSLLKHAGPISKSMERDMEKAASTRPDNLDVLPWRQARHLAQLVREIQNLIQTGDKSKIRHLGQLLKTNPLHCAKFTDDGLPLLHFAVAHGAYWVFGAAHSDDCKDEFETTVVVRPDLRFGALDATAYDLLALRDDAADIFEYVGHASVARGLTAVFARLAQVHVKSAQAFCSKLLSASKGKLRGTAWTLMVKAQMPASEILEWYKPEAGARKPTDARGRTLIMAAIESQRWDLALELARAGVWSEVLLDSGDTALHLALRASDLDAKKVRQLVSTLICADTVRAKNNDGRTAFLEAASQGNVPALFRLYSFDPATASARDKCGFTAVHLAAKSGHTLALRFLVSKLLLDIHDQANQDGDTPLHLAARAGHAQACAELLELGARADLTNKDGQNVLTAAGQSGDPETLLLLSTQVPLDCTRRDELILGLAQSRSQDAPALVEQLISVSGCRLEALDTTSGMSALHHAVLRDAAEFVRVLVENKADLRQKTSDGMNILHLVALAGSIKCAALLAREIKLCADLVLEQDHEGQTPVHVAAQKSQSAVLAVWMRQQWGSDLSSVLNSRLLTPGHVASDPKVKAMLQQ